MNATSRRKLRSYPSANFTITPSTITNAELDNLSTGATKTFTFSYRGEARIPTASGRFYLQTGYPSPTLTYRITSTDMTISKNNNAINPNGPDTEVMTLTLPATSEYPAATATLTFTNCDDENFQDI